MDEITKQSKLYNRLEINPTDYAIETFMPVFKEGPRAITGGQNEQGAPPRRGGHGAPIPVVRK